MKLRLLLVMPLLYFACQASAEIQLKNDSLSYRVEISATAATDGLAPLWLVSNKHGLSSLQDASGYLRFGVTQPGFEFTKSEDWNLGYGADLVVPVNYATESVSTGKQSSKFIIQQLFMDLDYKWMRLSIGAKERPMAMKHQSLSIIGI